jgi:hypothetical protein
MFLCSDALRRGRIPILLNKRGLRGRRAVTIVTAFGLGVE